MIEQSRADTPPLADAQEIERELLRLWRSVGESEKPMMRARVLSLVVVTEAARENEMAELM
nr:hypothetical protein [Ardenticatenales bacterium]